MDRVFWPLLALALALLVISTSNFLIISMALLFALVAVTWIKLSDIAWKVEDFKEKSTDHIENFENEVVEILKEKEESSESDISFDTDEFVKREIAEEKFDKMAEKLISMENELNKTKRNLATAFAALDDRLRNIEEELTILQPQEE